MLSHILRSPDSTRKLISDNGYESGSISRESGASVAHEWAQGKVWPPLECPEWPQVKSIACGTNSGDESLGELRSASVMTPSVLSPIANSIRRDPLIETTHFDRDSEFGRNFRDSFLNHQKFSNNFSTPKCDATDYQTLMKLCGEGDANALDSFLSTKPESLSRTGENYLGVMDTMKNGSNESLIAEPQVITSPIVSAILGGNSDCVRLLIEAGASVNSSDGIKDNMCARADCPLSCALRVNRMDVAEYLTAQGADVGEVLMRLSGCVHRSLAVLLNVKVGPNINMVVSRDPDMTALWRLVTPQILGLTNSPLETAFLLGRAFKLLSSLRPGLSSHWERLGTACERFSLQLIDNCLSSQEVAAVMSREQRKDTNTAPLHDALYYGRYEFVSHPAAHQLLKQRVTRTETGDPRPVDVPLSLLAPLLLPIFTLFSYLTCNTGQGSILRKYMYRIYAPFSIFSINLLADIVLFFLTLFCCIFPANEGISALEIVTWVLGFGVLVAELERSRLLVWYYQFRCVCDLLTLTWLTGIILVKLRLTSNQEWATGVEAIQIIYGLLFLTLSIRLLAIVKSLIPCNPLTVIGQIIPDFIAFVAVLAFIYLSFAITIHCVFTATAVSDHKAPSLENILLLSIQRVLSNSGTAGTISGQVIFIAWMLLSALVAVSFGISAFGKVHTNKHMSLIEQRSSRMRLFMMYEANHPVIAPFNLITLPITRLSRLFCRKGLKSVVWGDEDAYLFQSFQNDKRDSISRVCARLGGDKTSKADPLESESYEVIMNMREDLYRLYSKIDSESIKLDALQAVWSNFVKLQEHLSSLQTQVKSLLSDGEGNKTLLLEQTDRITDMTKLLENRDERRSAGSGASSGGRYSDI